MRKRGMEVRGSELVKTALEDKASARGLNQRKRNTLAHNITI